MYNLNAKGITSIGTLMLLTSTFDFLKFFMTNISLSYTIPCAHNRSFTNIGLPF